MTNGNALRLRCRLYSSGGGGVPTNPNLALEFSSVVTTALPGDIISNLVGLTPGYTPTLTSTGLGQIALTGTHLFVGNAGVSLGPIPIQVSEAKSGSPTKVTNLTVNCVAPITGLGQVLNRATLGSPDFDSSFTGSNFSTYDTSANPTAPLATYYPFGAEAFYSSRVTTIGVDQAISVDPYYKGLGLNPFSAADGIVKVGVFATPTADLGDFSLGTGTAGYLYYSAVLTTGPTFSSRYGCFEIRVQFMSGQGDLNGIWPSFYLLRSTLVRPPEVDVVELFGTNGFSPFADSAASTVHPTAGGQDSSFVTMPGHALDYHTFSVVLTPTGESFYIDDVLTKSTAYGDSGLGTDPWYIVAALGSLTQNGGSFVGDWNPAVTPISSLQSQMQHVRHYPLL